MTWSLVVMLAIGAYACKVVGLVVLGDRTVPPVVRRCLALIPAALITALVVKDTVSVGQQLVVDARLAGVTAAAIATWRRAPLVLVIVIGAGVTAVARAVT